MKQFSKVERDFMETYHLTECEMELYRFFRKRELAYRAIIFLSAVINVVLLIKLML